jgi:hypothetical protein
MRRAIRARVESRRAETISRSTSSLITLRRSSSSDGGCGFGGVIVDQIVSLALAEALPRLLWRQRFPGAVLLAAWAAGQTAAAPAECARADSTWRPSSLKPETCGGHTDRPCRRNWRMMLAGSMRRLLIILLFLAGFGILVWALRRPNAVRHAEPLVKDQLAEPSVADDMEPAASIVDAVPDWGLEHADITVMEIVPPQADLSEVAEPEPDDYQEPGIVASPSPGVHDPGELLGELIRIRREVVERVDRTPLFAMAEQRNVPYFRLFFMTKPELFEAVLEAEGVPPSDVLPSPDTAQRVRGLAAEAYRRHDEMAAEEAAHQTAS